MLSTPISLLLLACAAVTSVQAFQVTGPTGGINTATGQRPYRQEFSDFAQSGPAFDLYIQALQQFQADNQGAQLSYYQVAGIHGRPYIPWDGVQGDSDGGGYCTHSSILFPPWHRPYLALFEQIIWQNAQGIAARYPDSARSRYQAAATTLRIPYWDWAFNATMHSLLNVPTINVNTPNGQLNVNNPLYTYTFHPQPSDSDFPSDEADINKYPKTVRTPDRNGNSQPDRVNRILAGQAQSLHDQTYQLIADQSDYTPFSNTAAVSNDNNFGSLEALHNTIHGVIGGHMAWVPYSAFDPIFWLHHTNVDRLFAIWQAIYPDSYVTSQSSSGTFTNAFDSNEDINTPLTPFHSDSGSTLYTSVTARNTQFFGYSYPEVNDWSFSSPSDLSSDVRSRLNALYNPSGTLRKRALQRQRQHQEAQRQIQKRKAEKAAESYSYTLAAPSTSPTTVSTLEERNTTIATNDTTAASEFKGATTYEYFANIQVRKASLNSTFFVHFYLGDPDCETEEELFTASNIVGSATVLYSPPSIPAGASLNTTAQGNSTTQSAIQISPITYMRVSLGHALAALVTPPSKKEEETYDSGNATTSAGGYGASNGTLTSLHPKNVVPYLTKQLQWRVQLPDAREVDAGCKELKDGGFGVFVVGRTVTETEEEDAFPVYGGLRKFEGVTKGRKGGLSAKNGTTVAEY